MSHPISDLPVWLVWLRQATIILQFLYAALAFGWASILTYRRVRRARRRHRR